MRTRSPLLAAVGVMPVWRWCVGAMLSMILVACGGGGAGPEPSSAAIAPSVARQVDAGQKADLKETLVARPVSMVNTTTAANQSLRAIGALSDGGYAVAWVSGGTLYIQRYASAGNKVGTETPMQWVDNSGYTVSSSAVAVLSDGGVVVAYALLRMHDPQDSPSVDSVVLYIRRFDADGVQIVAETQVASVALGDHNHPAGFEALQLLPMLDGGYVLGWTTAHRASGGTSWNSFSAQHFDSHNQRLGDPTSINPSSLSNARFRMAADGLDGYTVYWSGYPSTALMVTHYDVNGTATQILAGWRGDALLVPMEHGRYVLYTILYTSGAGAYRQFLDSTGAPVGEATQVQFMPRSAQLLADGTYVVFWPTTSGGLTAQRYKANGQAIGDPLMLQVSGSQWLTAALQEGGFAVAWSDRDLAFYTQLFVDESATHQRKACLDHAKLQGLRGQERKVFVDACMASGSPPN